MELVINEDNLFFEEVQEFNSKVRAILVDESNRILVANYGSVILLPGGSVDEGETTYEAIVRELGEELGQSYSVDELSWILELSYYQKNYPKRDGSVKNRLVQTYYFVGRYKGVVASAQQLTEKEQKDDFRLELVSIDSLENMIMENVNNNPRNVYFQKELLTVLRFYKNMDQGESVKKLELK